jgi:peroxiredoxin
LGRLHDVPKSWIGLALGLGGLAVYSQSAVAAAVLTFVGLMLGLVGVKTINMRATRTVFVATVLLHALVVGIGAGDKWPLGLVPPFAWSFAIFHEAGAENGVGYRAQYAGPLAVLVAASIAALAWPGSWGWSVVPSLVLGGAFALFSVAFLRHLEKSVSPSWPLSVGEPMPDFELTRPDGSVFRLADTRGKHVLLALLVGTWCPLCHVKMRLYQKHLSELEEAGIKLVVVWSSSEEDSQSIKEAVGVGFPLLYDPDNVVGERLTGDIASFAGFPASARPSAFLIAPDGNLLMASRSESIDSFDPPSEYVRFVNAAT